MIKKIIELIKPYVLTKELITINETGFIGPFKLSNENNLDQIIEKFPDLGSKIKNRHIDILPIRRPFNDSSFLNCLNKISKKKFVLWRTNFFLKEDEGINQKEIPWHHDKLFQNDNEDIDFNEIGSHLSVLFALNDITLNNGVLEVIPGTHKQIKGLNRDIRPFDQKPISEHFMQLPEEIENKRIKIQIKRGEFIIFHSALIHRSLSYSYGNHRISLVGKLVSTDIQIPIDLKMENSCLLLG